MSTAKSYGIRVVDTDSQDIREMKMMRFIFALPLVDTTCLPKHEQACSLCKQPYNQEWKINNPETAVILPCGHVFGHFCIREWLSPFERGGTRCPRSGCGFEFPCPISSFSSRGQSITGGRLRPKLRPTAAESEKSNDGDDEYEEDEKDSVATEDIISELADRASAQDIEDEDPLRQIIAIIPSVHLCEDHVDVSSEQAKNETPFQITDAEVPETEASSKWRWVRDVFWTLDAFNTRNGCRPDDLRN